MMNYFYLEESSSWAGKYSIRFDIEKIQGIYTKGSYNVIASRLLNMTYPDYLRFCRDNCGAVLHGKNTIYPYPVFEKRKETNDLVKVLNERMNFLLAHCVNIKEN